VVGTNPSEYIRAGIIGSVVVTCFLFLLIVTAKMIDWLQRIISKFNEKWGLLLLMGISVSGIWILLFLLYILSLLL